MEVTVISLAAALTSLLAGGITASKLFQTLFRGLLGLPEPESKPYSERLSKLTQKLDAASSEVDEVLREIAEVAESRQKTVEKLEQELTSLEDKEKELKSRIETLENTPVEAAKHFADMISAGEQRSAKRDYLLFLAGVLVTTAVSMAIQFFVS